MKLSLFRLIFAPLIFFLISDLAVANSSEKTELFEKTYDKVVSWVWKHHGLTIHSAKEMACLSEDTILRPFAFAKIQNTQEQALRRLEVLNLFKDAGILPASHELSQLDSINELDVLRLYQADIRSLQSYLATEEDKIQAILGRLPVQMTAIAFERRLLRFQSETGVRHPGRPKENYFSALMSRDNNGLLRGSLSAAWGVQIKTPQELATLRSEDMNILRAVGTGRRKAEVARAAEIYRGMPGNWPDLFSLDTLKSREILQLHIAGVQDLDTYLFSISDQALIRFLALPSAKMQEILSERERLKAAKSNCSSIDLF